jgi:predicted ferric reductase
MVTHIQNFTDASSLEPHWGFGGRVVPCTNDKGSCEYLADIYHSHDLSMLFSGVLWLTIAGILFVWTLARRLLPSGRADEEFLVSRRQVSSSSAMTRFKNATLAYSRRYLLPDCARPVFGRTTRYQVFVLLSLFSYVTIFTFVGITYHIWKTPVKKFPGLFNTRSALGPFSDRIGVMAYALTPLSILLSSRESMLSVMTGVLYQSFNFLHRWLGYIILIQGAIHSFGWCLIEGKLYQPQPAVAKAFFPQTYIVWGIVAMLLIILLFVLSTPWAIRRTGYEFFRKTHYILAMLYVGACIAHWKKLSSFLIPSLIVWVLDRGARLIRTAILHHTTLPNGETTFGPSQAATTLFPDSVNGDVVRLDFTHPHDAWSIGQHFYLCFPQGSIWQSHPFTPLSLPVHDEKSCGVQHSYIFRAKSGETKKIAQLAAAKPNSAEKDTLPLTSVILTGPYGETITTHLTQEVNILCIAGGTGITYVLPVLLNLAQQPRSIDRKVTLVWAVRQKSDLAWVEPEMALIRQLAKSIDLTIRIFVTREAEGQSSMCPSKAKAVDYESKSGAETTTTEMPQISESSSIASTSAAYPCCGPPADTFTIQKTAIPASDPHAEPEHRHPELNVIVNEFIDNTVFGRTTVYASGPGSMISDLRSIVAQCNDGSKVWRGEERFDVELVCDDRLEW